MRRREAFVASAHDDIRSSLYVGASDGQTQAHARSRDQRGPTLKCLGHICAKPTAAYRALGSSPSTEARKRPGSITTGCRSPARTESGGTDWYSGHVEKEVGSNYGRLLQLYGVHKAMAEARRKGFTTRRQMLGDGSIKLTIGGVA